MIDYTKIIYILIILCSILLTLGIISKIKIIFAPIKVKLLLHITDFMEETLQNNYNKTIINRYLERKFKLKPNQNGEYDFTIKQMEKAIKANEESLDIDEDEYLDFVINTSIINTIDWCNKKSIKLGLNIYFVCIALTFGQSLLDAYYRTK